ncbi:hypothetical protein ACGFYV_21735 [Streptomyces sp. NPDC048297]|uniref:hypothetical protein n=1 Tax=Streptomyces sp. NPDC048297 TaxID=3365531 RepID=UPI0037248C3C
MDSSVWAGAAFGLAGTMIGGSLSIWSTVIAQRQQAAQACNEQRQTRAATATEAALTELLEIERDARRSGPNDEARKRLLHERILAIQVLMQRVPDSSLRDRVRENCLLMPLSLPDDTRTWEQRRVDRIHLSRDATACLGAYLRGEPIPPRTVPVERIRTHQTPWPAGLTGDTFFWEAEDQ